MPKAITTRDMRSKPLCTLLVTARGGLKLSIKEAPEQKARREKYAIDAQIEVNRRGYCWVTGKRLLGEAA